MLPEVFWVQPTVWLWSHIPVLLPHNIAHSLASLWCLAVPGVTFESLVPGYISVLEWHLVSPCFLKYLLYAKQGDAVNGLLQYIHLPGLLGEHTLPGVI